MRSLAAHHNLAGRHSLIPQTLGLLVGLWLLCLLPAGEANALTIHYNPDRPDALQTCDEQQYRGKREAAERCYETLLDDERSLVAALAARALGEVGLANRHFRDAAADSRDPVIRTSWGMLYLETHQISDASALFREALLSDEDYLPARLGLAAALTESFSGQAREELNRIVVKHPDNVHGLLLLAHIELELQNLATARGLLNRAMQAADRQNIVPLEIYALHAAANLLDDQDMGVWTRRALAINPHYGDAFSRPAHFYIITYRYREAVALYQKAVELDPQLASAHRDLGINLLRINNVFGARYHLELAYGLDSYDSSTVNTLRFLEDLDGMRVSVVDVPDPEADPDRANAYLARVLIRLDREDADALEPYVVELATQAVQRFTRRYNFRLKQPMIVELYHDHDDFGVRTVSTPGIGLLGVTFGYLTAMDSPRARAAGEFHWGSTLWHEIAHVFTLESTDHLLPRWMSEGLSVYEEWNTGPLADRELSLPVLDAIRNRRLLPIESLDAGFVRPTYQGQVQVSYMQAGLIADFIAREWGHQALVTMLDEFRQGANTAEALQAAIGLEGPAFDRRFNDELDQRFGDIVGKLDEYRMVARQLERAVEAEDWISVEALARDMIRRYPQRVSAGNPYQWLARAQDEQAANAVSDEQLVGEQGTGTQPPNRESLETLLRWHAMGGHSPAGLQTLIRGLREADRHDESAEVMESLNWVMPYVVDEHRWLGEYYLSQGNAALARREFSALLGLSTDDPAAAHLGKARAALLEENAELARREVLYSLEAAPFFRPAQRLLLELASGEAVD